MLKPFSLPDDPAELLQLALNDLEACEKEPDKYTVDMEFWFEKYSQTQPCRVCLAGAVLARHIGDFLPDYLGQETPGQESSLYVCTPSDFKDPIYHKLHAVDKFRVGNVEGGLLWMELSTKGKPSLDREIIDYDVDPTLFKHQIQGLIDDLKRAKLGEYVARHPAKRSDKTGEDREESGESAESP